MKKKKRRKKKKGGGGGEKRGRGKGGGEVPKRERKGGPKGRGEKATKREERRSRKEAWSKKKKESVREYISVCAMCVLKLPRWVVHVAPKGGGERAAICHICRSRSASWPICPNANATVAMP